MIILLYMRSLRLLSILIFALLCGPVLLYCWWKNREEPEEDPSTLNENFVKVTYDTLIKLREKNYRHKSLTGECDTPSKSQRRDYVTSLDPDKAESDSNSSLNESMVSTNPYDLEAGNQNNEITCCICMEDVSDCADEENPSLVILPCKAHFFHDQCISAWMQR